MEKTREKHRLKRTYKLSQPVEQNDLDKKKLGSYKKFLVSEEIFVCNCIETTVILIVSKPNKN